MGQSSPVGPALHKGGTLPDAFSRCLLGATVAQASAGLCRHIPAGEGARKQAHRLGSLCWSSTRTISRVTAVPFWKGGQEGFLEAVSWEQT